jgi:hypothetical protein
MATTITTAATPDYAKNKKIQNGVFIILTALFVGLGVWISKKYNSKVMWRFGAIAIISYGIAALVMHKVIPCGRWSMPGEAKPVTPTPAPAVTIPAANPGGADPEAAAQQAAPNPEGK